MLNPKKIETLLSERKMSKTKLCSSTGIARTTLDAILNGGDAKISTIETIADILNVKIGYLFDEEVELRNAGRDYVERGKIEHKGPEYHMASTTEADLRDQISVLKSQLADKERIIKLMEEQK